jgi:hypothetical protein
MSDWGFGRRSCGRMIALPPRIQITLAKISTATPRNCMLGLTMRLSDARGRRHKSKLLYSDHRPSPWPIEDVSPRSLEPMVRGYRYIQLKINEQGKDRIYACRSVHCGGDVGSSRNVLIQKRGSAILPVIAVEYKGLVVLNRHD